jgi:hypothetical protein
MAKTMQRVPVSAREVRIVRRLRKVTKLSVPSICLVTERDKKTIKKMLKASWRMGKRGQPPKLSSKQVTAIIKVMRSMIKKAKAAYEIPLAAIMRKAKVKCHEKTLRTQLHKRGIRFRRMRTKPLLTAQDVIDRYNFAKKYKGKSKAWWVKNIHLFIDLKTFPVYPNRKARLVAAQRTVRGAYRGLKGGLGEGYVVVPKGTHGSYCKSVKIAAGVGNGKVLMWHQVTTRWSSKTACDLYEGAMLDALRKGWPRKRAFTILEDNDQRIKKPCERKSYYQCSHALGARMYALIFSLPTGCYLLHDPTGFKSKAALRLKAKAHIGVLEIPKRSPDLSLCDYVLWVAVSRAMRTQEKRFAPSKKETRAEYIARLKRTAVAMPRARVERWIGDMARRCKRCYDAKGRLFEEGGRSGVMEEL